MRRLRAAGFTLIEVLVALVIVAVGMAAVMGTLTSSASTLSYLRDHTFAQYLALNHIATLRLAGQAPATGNSSGDEDYGGRSWHWRQEVTTTDVPGVVRIDFKVRPKEVQAGDDEAWTTTVSGIFGNAVGRPDGYSPNWGAQAPPYAQNPNGQQQRGGVSNLGGNMQLSSPSSGGGLGSDLNSGNGLSLDNPDNPPPQPPQPEPQQQQ